MPKRNRLTTSYTIEELLEKARKYSNKTDFHNYDRSACRAARKLGVFDQCTAHMILKQRPKGYWTKELCHKEALPFRTRNEFCMGSSAAYQAAQENGWLDDICVHMISPRKKKGFWQNEMNCLLEALQYDSKKDFARGSPRAYDVALEKNILDKICSHMVRKGNSHNKLIYAWEFPDKSVYVGLTFCPENREKHRKTSDSDAVIKHVKNTGLTPTHKQKTGYIPVNEAIKMEAFYIKWYSDKGWNILNRSKPGAIGGNIIIWTKNNCITAARKCWSQKEFREKYPSAYGRVLINKWKKECYKHLQVVRKPLGFWTKSNIHKAALTCKTRIEFETKYGSAYNKALKKNILNEVCKHMKYIRMPNNYWSLEKCLDIATKCASKLDFIRNHKLAYQAARNNKWSKIIYWAMQWSERY